MRTGLTIALIAAVLAACEGVTEVPPLLVQTVEVGPSETSVYAGETLRLTVYPKTAGGEVLGGLPVAWTVDDTLAAELNASGIHADVQAKRAGTVLITAEVSGKLGTARVIITELTEVASVQVSPAVVTITPSGSTPLAAQALDAQGRPVEGRPVEWTTDRAAVATVTSAGVVTGVGVGVAVITATIDGRSGSAQVSVEQPAGPVAVIEFDRDSVSLEEGGRTHLTATPRDAQGQVVEGRVVQWSSSDVGVALVAADGGVTAIRPGTAWIRARVDQRTDSARVGVHADHAFDLVYDGYAPGAALRSVFLVDPRDPARQGVRLLAENLYAVHPAPAPGGQRVAFVTSDGIFVANRDGRDSVRLTSAAVAWGDDQPAWSRDGTRLAFRRRVTGQGTSIWVIDADGGNARNLTADQGESNQSWPSWSPAQPGGGYRIAYSHSSGGMGHLYTMRDDGQDKRQVTGSASAYDDHASWSPDGTQIAFERSGPAIFGDLYVVNATGGGERVLVSLPFQQFAPAWSPDGSLVAFTSNHETGDRQEVYTVRVDGGLVARRTDDDIDKGHPVWIQRP